MVSKSANCRNIDVLKSVIADFDDLGSTPSTPHYAIDGKSPITNDSMDLQRQIHELTLEVNHFLLRGYMGFENSNIYLIVQHVSNDVPNL